jgi:hypothetical protein
MSNTTTAMASWPGNKPDKTTCYRAVKAGLIYELRPATRRPGYWHAAVKRGNRHLRRLLEPLREDVLGNLFLHGFFPVGLELKAVNVRNLTRR